MASQSPIQDDKAPRSSSFISPKEMKELKRVFDTLCHYATKSRHHNSARRREIDDYGGAFDDESTYMSVATAITFSTMDINIFAPDNQETPHIRVEDIRAALRDLGKKASKEEATVMMWEVDENMDGVCDWDEFQLMFERNIRDTSGLEPAKFYHMVQFMIYDHDGNGFVSIDETMNILYARLGREKMEEAINKLFSDDGAPVKEIGEQGGEIDFIRFWTVSKSEQMRIFSESEKGKLMKERKQKQNKRDETLK